MISDYQILGISEDSDLPAVKSAFRKRAKELHPDLSTLENAMARHDRFIEVCKAYRRLTDGCARPLRAEQKKSAIVVTHDEVVPHHDQAYVFYKQGMKFFMSIHPSQWNLGTARTLNTQIAGRNSDEQEAIKQKIIELAKLFPRAYYYFSIVIHEYPDSEWAYDSREKMGKIEERMGMYRKIIESFTSWNKDKKEAIRKYNETYSKMNKALREARGDMPEDWR
jgi:hypothetical protein